MTPYLQIPVQEVSQIGEARRAAARLTSQAHFNETAAGRAALVVTELATNLARHAQHGRMLIGLSDTGALDILSLDDGPGMADLKVCLRDGFSTGGGGTPGTGLGAAQRVASGFSGFSVPGKGSVLYARIDPHGDEPPSRITSRFSVAGINLAAPGETVSGDGWCVRIEGNVAALMVADGLGHGLHAAEASDAALQSFMTSSAPVTTLPSQTLERAHEGMRSLRGAAVATAVLDAQAGTLRFAGIGNICGRVLSGVEDRSLMSQHGIVGHQIRSPQDVDYAWPEHAFVILHSDGVSTRWTLADTPGLLQCEPAVMAGWLLREHARGRDDATVVVLRRAR